MASRMPGWDALLDRLAEAPRENGSQALEATATWLAETLRAAGVADVTLVPWTAHPYRLRIFGVVVLAGALLYTLWMRRGQGGRALAVALLVPALSIVELDFFVPVLGWGGAATQHHVVAEIPPAGDIQQRLVLSAHFDTKTDALDHVERAPVEILGFPVGLLMIAAAIAARRGRAPRLATAAVWIAPLYGVAAFVAFTGGAFMSRRSPGALDDGAACAVLVRVAERLAARPLEKTAVEIVLFSGEEIGVEGSWRWARERWPTPPREPTLAVNLEVVGAPDLAYARSEAFLLRRFAPDPQLVAVLDAIHTRRRGRALARTPVGAGTDARSFLAHGVPAVTLLGDIPGQLFFRGLHSARDDRSRVDERALDGMLDYLLDVAREIDRPSARAAESDVGQ